MRIGDQNAGAAARIVRLGRLDGPALERQLEPEIASFPRLTVYTDLAAHQFDQALANRQTKAGASMLSGARSIHLRERLKKPVLRRERNAGSRIADRKQ